MQLSAFVDGELPENEAEMLLRRMSQDIELRQQVAEYLALSRMVRAEVGIAGADRLHERVAAEIDDRPAAEMQAEGGVDTVRSVKPLLGFAVAATVALLAIFGLQQANNVDEATPASPNSAVPELAAEQQREYFLNHADASSQHGANSIKSRLVPVTLRFSEDVADEADADKLDDKMDDKMDDNKSDTDNMAGDEINEETTTQP